MTPDSFSDGSRFIQLDSAVSHAEKLLSEGANIIDIGGESTRPGATPVTVAEEINRVVPLVERVKKLGGLVSVDTSKPEVMRAAAEVGADMINDVRALSLPGAIEAVAELKLAVCLMHMQGEPDTMQNAPKYHSVVDEVSDFLDGRIACCVNGGVAAELISIDPGFGFGKTAAHNLELLNQLSRLTQLKKPILVGLSRKSLIGQITGRQVCDRLAGSLAFALVAMQQGAQIIRVHDVKQTLDVKKIFLSLKSNAVTQ